MLKRLWWWFRGLGANGENYLYLCQRCGRRGLWHAAPSTLVQCRRFVDLPVTMLNVGQR